MAAFQDYWSNKQVYDANQLQNLQTILPKPAENAVFNSSILFKTIDDRQYMTDQELRYFIHNNFLSIIANVLDPAVADGRKVHCCIYGHKIPRWVYRCPEQSSVF